jgi:D-hydroxyproline dehydrogenase subunit alpha
MAAAVAVAASGATVAVIDLAPRPGGQYWRWGPATSDGRYHHGWARFEALHQQWQDHERTGRLLHLPGQAVYSIRPGPPWRVHAVAERTRAGRVVDAAAVVVATGSYDRQLPIPGWTLPGVMAAGAAQSLLKGSGVVAGRRVVVAGSGPLLLPVASGLAAAGAKVVAVAEAGDPVDYLRRPAALAGAWPKLPEAAGYLARLARYRVPLLRRHAAVAAHGDGRLTRVTLARIDRDWRPVPGTGRQVEADVLAVGYGFVPQVELLREAGAELVAPGGAAAVVAGADQRTSVPGIYAAGETTGVGGADLAVLEGSAAGRAAAALALGGTVTPRSRPGPTRARDGRLGRRAGLERFAQLLQQVHAVRPGWTSWPDAGTVLCRCEEVTLAELDAAVELGADDLRTAKLLARPGMGWCQGRMCTLAVADLLEARTGRPKASPPADSRPLAQPVPLGVLADLSDDPDLPGEPDLF